MRTSFARRTNGRSEAELIRTSSGTLSTTMRFTYQSPRAVFDALSDGDTGGTCRSTFCVALR